MPDPAPPPPAHLAFQVTSSAFDAHDARWQSQVRLLVEQLQAHAGPVRRVERPAAGMKGGLAELIVALGSAGAIQAAVQVFQSWLKQRTNSSLILERTVDGRTERLVLSAQNLSEETIRAALGSPPPPA